MFLFNLLKGLATLKKIGQLYRIVKKNSIRMMCIFFYLEQGQFSARIGALFGYTQ